MLARRLRSLAVLSVRLGSFAPPLTLALAPSLLGCGGAPPPVAAPEPNAGNAKVTTAAALPPDLTPVPEPEHMVVYGRVARPSASIGIVSGWLRAQLPGVPPVGSDAVSELLAGESVGELLDLDQPIDMAATAAPRMGSSKGHFAVSAAVKSPERAKAVLTTGSRKLTPGSNGMLRVEGLGPPQTEDEEDPEARSCALVPAAGAAPMRFVCGFGPGSLETLAPWLTRSAPRQPSASDMHVELRFTPLHKFVEENRAQLGLLSTLAMGKGGSRNPALGDLVLAVMNEGADLVLDLETVAMDVRLEGAAAEATLTTKYRSTSSVLARLATFRPDRVDVPPASFLRLPGDAEVGIFSRGFDPKDIERPRDLALAAVGKELEKDGLTAGDAKALTDALAKMVTSTPAVYGAGVDMPAVDKALAGVRSDDAAPEAKATLRDALVGWRLMGYEEPSARLGSAMKELVAAFNRPAFTKWVKTQNKDKAATTLRLAPLAKGMPKDAVHVELTVASKAPPVPPRASLSDKKKPAPKVPAPRPLRLHAYVVPDGTTTWLAFGANDALVAERARGVLGGAPEASTLVKRAGLEELREAKLHAGGFVTLEGVLTTLMSLRALDNQVPRRGADALAVLAQAPGKGATPLPLLFNVTPSQGGGAVSVARVKLPRAAIEDAVRLAVRGAISM